jgi:hypothetical protein
LTSPRTTWGRSPASPCLTFTANSGHRPRGRLHEFEAVAERIRHVDTVEPPSSSSSSFTAEPADDSGHQTSHIVDDECALVVVVLIGSAIRACYY